MFHGSDIVSMDRSRSIFTDKKQNKKNECKPNQKFTEIVANLTRMHNENIVDDNQYRQILGKEIIMMQTNGTHLKQVCINLKWLKDSGKINNDINRVDFGKGGNEYPLFFFFDSTGRERERECFDST